MAQGLIVIAQAEQAKHLDAISFGATGAEGENKFPLLSHYDGLNKQVISVKKKNILACPLPLCSATFKGKISSCIKLVTPPFSLLHYFLSCFDNPVCGYNHFQKYHREKQTTQKDANAEKFVCIVLEIIPSQHQSPNSLSSC